jgi:hypothetical protein
VQFSTLGLMEALMQAVQRGDNVFQVLGRQGWLLARAVACLAVVQQKCRSAQLLARWVMDEAACLPVHMLGDLPDA